MAISWILHNGLMGGFILNENIQGLTVNFVILVYSITPLDAINKFSLFIACW